MNTFLRKGGKHLVAILLFLALSVTYFAPCIFDGLSVRQADNEKATGFGSSQMDKYEKTAKPGEFSQWSDAMFGGMPYVASYGTAAPSLPSYQLLDSYVKKIGYLHASMVFLGLLCFYILMCVMGVNWWLAIAGSIGFAFASYNLIIIAAGHVVKGYVIGYMPLTIAGMILLFKRKWLWGSVAFLLGVAYSIANHHIQITYYLVLCCLILYIGYLIQQLSAKHYKDLLKSSLIMLGCVLLAVMPNARSLYSQWELGQQSIRGKSDLTPALAQDGTTVKKSSGLDKDYAFQWSYGWGELLTTLVPEVYGGESGGSVGPSSALYKALQAKGAQVSDSIRTYTYWGNKPFTSGPVYFGSILCFLFLFGMIVISNKIKWAYFISALFLTFLALGRNFDLFNDVMFHYLPIYNKFRTVEMALVIPGLIFPIIGMWGIKEMMDGKVNDQQIKKGLLWSLGITGGLCLLLWLAPTFLLSFQSPQDAQIKTQIPNWYYTALVSDRISLASHDAMRSLFYILAAATLLYLYWKAKDRTKMLPVLGLGLIVLILTDLWTIDRRYLNEDNFVKQTSASVYQESKADQFILKDKTLSYRVLTLSNPWEETSVSYYHHSVGGYYAAKMRRYQELIAHKLDAEKNEISQTLSKAKSGKDLLPMLQKAYGLNMLNTKYIIYNPKQAPLTNPFAYGNAWFIDQLKLVDNADAEMAGMQTIDPKKTALVDRRFADDIKGFTPEADSTASIELTSYRPNILRYTSSCKREQLAVFSEIYFQPGWIAKIDGKEYPHFRANWILRAMRIPAGEHTITFEFRPQGYIIAANISAYSSFLILLLLLIAIGCGCWQELKEKKEKA